jgi:5-oxoprolinase (ATP-hydrolysing)
MPGRIPIHEIIVEDACKRAGFSQISVSHQVSPLAKLVGRGDTTVVDAYLSPILRRYVDRVAGVLGATPSGEPGPTLQFMMSSGGLTAADMFRGKDAILSGPAGGVVGMVETAALAGFDKVIGFDMGGTSTDVAHYDGDYERAFDTEVAGVRIRAPMMRIHTVAAGGGSILHSGEGRFRAGPDSAGANPGPACYRRGGPLTVTDANVMLGKLQPDFFPAIFGPGQDQPLDVDAVRHAFDALARTSPARAPRKSPKASSPLPSRTWPTPSRRSRCSAAMTSPVTCSTASAAPAASTPAWWPMRWAWNRSSFTRSPACSRPTASASQASSPAASRH